MLEKKGLRRKWVFSLLALILLCAIIGAAGCASSPKSAGDMVAPQEAAVPAAELKGAKMVATSMAGERALFDSDVGSPAVPDSLEPSTQYIIRNAYLTLIITDIEEASKEIQQKVAQLQGYVSSMELYDLTQERRAGRISLRIPQDKFDLALTMLEEVGKIKNKNVSSQDVTLQYIDLEARIATMEAQEERLRDLLDRAEKVEEVLEVEKELWRVRGNLESMIAEFRHLQQRVSYSSIDIYLEEKDPLTTSLVEDLGIWEKIGNLLALNTNRLLRGGSSLIIVTIGWLPILLPLILLALLFRKIASAVKARKKVKIQEQTDKVAEG